jgi:hypothetical protein
MSLLGTTPTLTLGDGGEEDVKIQFNGVKDFYIANDDSADKLLIGEGSTVGTNPILTITDDTVTLGDGAAVDTALIYDGNAKDFYVALDDSADKLVIGEGSTVGTNNILTIDDDSVTIGDGAAVDTKLVFDGNAQDYYVGLDDSADDLVIGLGSTVGTTPAVSIDENQKATFPKAVTASTSANITQVALTSSSNAVAWDAAAAANAYHLTTENTTFSAPSNAVEGAIISVEIAQGSTARTIAWNTVFEFAASTAPTITATANKTDILSFRYNGSVWQEIGRVQNLAQT